MRSSALGVGRLALLLILVVSGCTRQTWRATQDSASAIETSGGPWASMIYLARTDSGIIVIDLGWVGAERHVRRGLARLHATPADVRYVFLTHAHRDHTYGWRFVRGARFVIGAAEVPYFTGNARYHGFLPRIGDRLVTYPHPKPGELSILALGADSAIALGGGDTVFTFGVPGHTPGSTAFLFRRTLFAGDAINWRPWTGFRGARPEFSDNVSESRQSMLELWQRLDSSRVRTACSAHAKCSAVNAEFRMATLR